MLNYSKHFSITLKQISSFLKFKLRQKKIGTKQKCIADFRVIPKCLWQQSLIFKTCFITKLYILNEPNEILASQVNWKRQGKSLACEHNTSQKGIKCKNSFYLFNGCDTVISILLSLIHIFQPSSNQVFKHTS